MNAQPNSLDKLKRAYDVADADSFALFLGAGVNLFPSNWDIKKRFFDTYSWKELLEAIYLENKQQIKESFDSLTERYKQDWPGLASEIAKNTGVETLVGQLDSIVYNKLPRKDRYGRLSRRLLNQSPTLQAAICFSTKISCQTETSWTFARNPKIGSIITSNFDYFFGAGWTLYQSFHKQWKVHTPFGKNEPTPDQRTINYIHGYLPYKLGEKKKVVLTRESYEEFYAPNGFSINKLQEAIRSYNIIFLGTSFVDIPLCKTLEQFKGERQHFIIDKEGSDAIQRAKTLGVQEIAVKEHSDIALALQEIYTCAVNQKECERVGLKNPQSYWERLKRGPNKNPHLS